MKSLSLQELKEIELQILIVFQEFCKKNNIRYFLAYGTLLGAIRYKKFIPWDDDVDVLVPREDYNKLLALFQDNERYKLFSYERNQNFLFPFAKLCDMRTRKIETGYNNGIDLGVDIDIFPLDEWPDNLDEARKEAKYINRNMFLLNLTKLEKPDSHNIIKRFIKGIVMNLCKLIGSKYFIKKILSEVDKPGEKGSNFVGCKVWCVYKDRGIVSSKAFSESIDVEFEGMKFSAPVGYDEYLTSLYGDYLPEPPIEKRKTHHLYRAYKL